MPQIDLELSLRKRSENNHVADLHARLPTLDADLASNVSVNIDHTTLLAATLDPEVYGRDLSAMLFTTTMREAWSQALGYRQGNGETMRLRLWLDPADDSLHSLCWETLHDPKVPAPLALSENVLFSRYIGAPNLADVQAPQRPDLRALVVVANPAKLEDYNLAPVDTDGEVARARTALGDIPTDVLAYDTSGEHASLERLAARLRDGPHILYLVCHGSLVSDQPYLWLETTEGNINRVSGAAFVQVISNLSKQPLLIVLASCQSAGRSHDNGALAAVGPQLARAGVAAVVGMQGNITMRTVRQMMPVFFRELRRDGQIDRALAAARGAIRDRPDWWMPVLFMRVRDGRLWREPGAPEPAGALTNNAAPKLATVPADAGASQAEIDQYVEQLRAERDRLNDLLLQLAKFGSAWAPPVLISSIRDARREIKKIKQALEKWGVKVEDRPNDEG